MSPASLPSSDLPTFDKIFVLYASQTGQAESISEFIFDQFTSSSGPLRPIRDRLGEQSVQRHCASNYEKIIDEFLQPKSQELRPGFYLAIVVASTTGSGDPPDKANKFFRWLRRLKRTGSNDKIFNHLSYALLGLGDTNYDIFANFGHQLDKHFTALGAQPYIPTKYADDAVGLEIVTEPFIEDLTQALIDDFGLEKPAELPKPIIIKKVEKSESSKEADKNKSDPKGKVETKIMSDSQSVASFCSALSDTDKLNLNDICRLLIEPSEKLLDITDDTLALPKVSFSPPEDGSLDYLSTDDSDVVSMFQYLNAKVQKETPFYEAQVNFNRLLSQTSDASKLCCHKAKTVIECDVEFNVANSDRDKFDFHPGDAYGIYSSNLSIDVYQFMISVMVRTAPEKDLGILWLYLTENGINKNVYFTLADKSKVELLSYLFYGVDLHSIPKKITLCHFAQFTSDPRQKRRLLELSSREGNADYQNYFLGHKLTVCDILRLFDTCHPPISVVLHYLTASRPRYFSAASIPKSVEAKNDIRAFKILFTVSNGFTHTFKRSSELLLGLFSGKFFKHYEQIDHLPNLACTNVWDSLEKLHLLSSNGDIFKSQPDVSLQQPTSLPAYVFPRANKSFQVTSDLSKPLIFISAGTGIAPFLAFIEQRKNLIAAMSGDDVLKRPLGEVYFFFGCRHPYEDFTYSDEIVECSKGAQSLFTHLCLCFSRCSPAQTVKFATEHELPPCIGICEQEEKEAPKHVDQLIEHHGREIVELLVEKDAHIYVCGDWKKMSASLSKTMCAILSEYYLEEQEPSPTSPAAAKYLKELQKQGRYVLDIWT